MLRYDPLQPETVESVRLINSLRVEFLTPFEKFYRLLSRCAAKFDDPPLIGMRIKGLKPIVDKLKRHPSMNLMRMQDLIAARVVVENMEELAEFKRLCTRPGSGFRLVRERNYIEEPHPCGYRALLLVFTSNITVFNTELPVSIELEIVTKKQHLWSSALETTRMFQPESRMPKRFMPTVASLFALSEGAPVLQDDRLTSEKELLTRFGKRQLLMSLSFCCMHAWEGDFDASTHDPTVLLVTERYPDSDSSEPSDGSGKWESIRRFGFPKERLKMAQEIALGYEDSSRYWNDLTRVQLVYTETPERIKEIFPSWFGMAQEFENLLWALFETIDPADLVKAKPEPGQEPCLDLIDDDET